MKLDTAKNNIKHFHKKPFVVTPAEMVEILGL